MIGARFAGSPMRIILDIQAAVTQKAGVGQYTWYLARYLPEILGDDEELGLFCFDFRRRAGKASELPPGSPFHCCRWLPGRLVQYGWKKTGFPPYHWFAGKADLYHFPNFIIPPGVPGRAVVTVHDVAFIRYPEFTEKKNLAYLRSHLVRTLRRADHVFTDSEFSRREVLEHFDVPEDRVTTLFLAVDDRFRKAPSPERIEEVRRKLRLPESFFLTVCTLEPRKNLVGLIRAFRIFRDRNPDLRDLKLVIAGSRGWKDSPILAEIDSADMRDAVVWLGYIEHDELPSLYRMATAFVFPSFYEGFGMPPAEAMASEVPTVCSEAASLPEVVGDAALLVDPRSPESIAGGMERVIRDTDLRARLIREGPRRVARFTWPDTARTALDLYRRIVRAEGRR